MKSINELRQLSCDKVVVHMRGLDRIELCALAHTLYTLTPDVGGRLAQCAAYVLAEQIEAQEVRHVHQG